MQQIPTSGFDRSGIVPVQLYCKIIAITESTSMKEVSDSDKPALRKRPEYQSLLDQLETTIERDVSGPGVLNILSLRLLALNRQRSQLHTPADEQVDQKEDNISSHSVAVPDVLTPNMAPSSVAKKMTTNKLQSWLSRRKNE
jgi:hypothetical protein